MSQDDNKQDSLGSAAVAGVGSVALGAGAQLLSVNNYLRENLEHAMKVSPDSRLTHATTVAHRQLERAKEKVLAGGKGNPRAEMRRVKRMVEQLLGDLNEPELVKAAEDPRQVHWGEMRKALKDEQTVLGAARAHVEAQPRNARHLEALLKARQTSLDFTRLVEESTPKMRAKNPHLQEEYEVLRRNMIEAVPGEIEAANQLVSDIVKEVPLMEKLTLKNLHMTTRQKTAAFVAFGAVTAITALGLYRVAEMVRGHSAPER